MSPPEMFNLLDKSKLIYLDIETYSGDSNKTALDTLTAVPRLITLHDGGENVYVIDAMMCHMSAIQDILKNCTFCGHNMFYDLPIICRHYSIPIPDVIYDTMVASIVLTNGMTLEGGHKLASCITRYLGVESHAKDMQTSDWSELQLSEQQLQYAVDDVLCLKPLHDELQVRLERFELSNTYQLECETMPSTINMMMVGIGVDAAQWKERSQVAAANAVVAKESLLSQLPLPPEEPQITIRINKDGTQRVSDVRKYNRIEAYNATRQWNLNSPIQLINALGQVGVSLASTAYETLMEMKFDYPILDTLLEYRDYNKEASAFGEEWLEKYVRHTGRVHPQWRQLGTASGRLSCGDPNLTQTPRGECRKGIIAAKGKVLVRADFSQIEARTTARISRDPNMMRIYMENKDIHKYVASEVLNKPIEEITKEERQIGKSLVFGLLFGMGAARLQVYCKVNYGVNLSEHEAVKFRAKFFNLFEGLVAWHQKAKQRQDETIIRTMTGRRRILLKDAEGVASRMGIHLNTPVQGTAADISKLTAARLWKERHTFPDTHQVALIHDEFMMETPEEYAEPCAEWLKRVMIETGNKVLDPVPVDAEVKIGKSWEG